MHSLYTTDGSIRCKTASVLDEQDRTLEEAEYNAAGSLFRRFVHTHGCEGRQIATVAMMHRMFSSAQLANLSMSIRIKANSARAMTMALAGYSYIKWEYASEQNEQGN
mgnify:CR=1 FL=1